METIMTVSFRPFQIERAFPFVSKAVETVITDLRHRYGSAAVMPLVFGPGLLAMLDGVKTHMPPLDFAVGKAQWLKPISWTEHDDPGAGRLYGVQVHARTVMLRLKDVDHDIPLEDALANPALDYPTVAHDGFDMVCTHVVAESLRPRLKAA